MPQVQKVIREPSFSCPSSDSSKDAEGDVGVKRQLKSCGLGTEQIFPPRQLRVVNKHVIHSYLSPSSPGSGVGTCSLWAVL